MKSGHGLIAYDEEASAAEAGRDRLAGAIDQPPADDNVVTPLTQFEPQNVAGRFRRGAFVHRGEPVARRSASLLDSR